MSEELTHLNAAGEAHMVDVSAKTVTDRTAEAEAWVHTTEQVIGKLRAGTVGKGDALAVARVAGIMAAKKTPELIPLCHGIMLTKAAVEFELTDASVHIRTRVATRAVTGVEMEALTAASVAALTIYDMIKALDKSALITDIRLLTKTGGKSGAYDADAHPSRAPRPGMGSQGTPAAAVDGTS